MKELVECSNIKLARISASPMSNVFTKIHTPEPDDEEAKKDGEPKEEPFPSVDESIESDTDSGDDDEESTESPPTVASIPLPV
jgi:hypothetical protein